MTERPSKKKWTLGRIRAWLRYFVVGIETPLGRAFDLMVIGAIVVGVVELVLDSVPRIHDQLGNIFGVIEIAIGALFLFEYLARIWTATNKRSYLLSFFGIIDFLALLPFFVGLFVGDIDLTFLRLFRVLRIFSVLKIGQYTNASRTLLESLRASSSKITIFVLGVLVLIVCESFVVYIVEPQTFPTITDAIWWTIVTITTVGYGDVYPTTLLGKIFAAFSMLTSFGIIAVPTGIVAAEFQRESESKRTCNRCAHELVEIDANYCSRCGLPLNEGLQAS